MVSNNILMEMNVFIVLYYETFLNFLWISHGDFHEMVSICINWYRYVWKITRGQFHDIHTYMKNPLGPITRYTYIDVYEKKLSIFFSRVLCLESPMQVCTYFHLVFSIRTSYTLSFYGRLWLYGVYGYGVINNLIWYNL